MLDTPSQNKLHKHVYIFSACEHIWAMMIMVGSKLSKTEYDLKAINAGRPMRQLKCASLSLPLKPPSNPTSTPLWPLPPHLTPSPF